MSTLPTRGEIEFAKSVLDELAILFQQSSEDHWARSLKAESQDKPRISEHHAGQSIAFGEAAAKLRLKALTLSTVPVQEEKKGEPPCTPSPT